MNQINNNNNTCSIYSYNDINFTYLYMRSNDLRHLAIIIDIQWSRPVGGVGKGRGEGGGGEGGDKLGNYQLNWLTCCKRQKKCSNFAVADKHDAVLEVIDGQAML